MKRIIVDKNDRVIGAKESQDIDFLNEIYRVSALWLWNSSGEVLVAQRKKSKGNDAGKWGPSVAGTVEEGESYEQNIVKEVEEEIGVRGVEISLDKKHFVSSKEKSKWTKEAKQKFHECLRNIENTRRRNGKNLTQRKLFKAEEILENLIKQKMLFPKKARKRLAMIKENWRYFTAFYEANCNTRRKRNDCVHEQKELCEDV